MALSLYQKKRDFKKTREPKGAPKKRASEQLAFVVQQHSATRLHYDFRLEMEGVLKSWAVPKGPSMNPEDKRLAVMVEDHPFDYKDFEGTIPEGNYGAGNVIVWDNGVYHAVNATDAKESEELLLKGLKKGHISFVLQGKKLKGEFALVKLRGREENQWLLIKKNDKYATTEDILKKNKSVVSRKILQPRVRKQAGRRPRQQTPSSKIQNDLQLPPLEGGGTLQRLRPMLAEIKAEPFNDPDWIFEVKYDGYRAMAIINDGKVELYSRNLLTFTKYNSIVDELKKIDRTVLLDGEVVVEDEHGISQFQLLQNFQRTGRGELKYYVFDLLYLDQYDLTKVPLIERKDLLQLLLKNYKLKNIFYSDHIKEKGKEFFEEAGRRKLEGIIAKDKKSPYRRGRRSGEWLKIKLVNEQEAVIGGITEPQGSRMHFGSLLLGVHDNGDFTYIGNCGTGFTESTLKELYQKLQQHFISESPFHEKFKLKHKTQWVEPVVVCKVKFTEWTDEGIMRHPVYQGLVTDKDASTVERELPLEKKQELIKHKRVKTYSEVETKEPAVAKPKKSSADKKPPKTEKELKVGKVTLYLTNQQKVYWPDDGFTKGDLVNYYTEIAPYILPYLKDRPQSLNRFPNGITAPSFYQKDLNVDQIPKWVRTEKVFSDSNNANINYLICNDQATLIYMANLGCIEINPWNSRLKHLDNPDWMVIDLDPGEIGFEEVVRTALVVKKVSDEMKIECYCKTSGATGLHVYFPLGAKYDYEVVRNFGHIVANEVHIRLPDITSIERTVSKRKKRIYVDYLQNSRGQTLASPYSVRPRPGATVSTPLDWSEVNAKLHPSNFTMKNILKRLEKKGDLWKPILGKGIDLKKLTK